MPIRLSIVALLVGLALVAIGPAFAHTGLVDSTPAEKAEVDRPVRRIKLTFGAPVDLAPDRAEVLDATGDPVNAKIKVDGRVVVLRPRDPLGAGEYGVRWALRSDDGHVVRDSITFTIASDVAAPTTSDTAVEDADDSGIVGAADAADPADAHSADAAGDTADAPVATEAALAATLSQDATRLLDTADVLLRALFTALALTVIGTITFAVAAWQGSRRELRMLTRLLARLSAVLVITIVAQVAVRAAQNAGGWDTALSVVPTTLTGPYGVGIAMRLTGAAVVLAGLPQLRRALRGVTTMPIAGGAADLASPHLRAASDRRQSPRRRWRSAGTTIVGALLLVASFTQVGHAATAQARIVVSLATAAHVLAAAIWGGGLVALSCTLAHRHRARVALRAGLVAVRFSVLATVGVLIAAAAGVALAALRLESITALWTTGYGLALSAKVAVVLVTAGIGAYNHVAVVPVLERAPDHAIGRRLQRLGLVEIALLAVVVCLTSLLVSLGS